MKTTELTVAGMTCTGCEASIGKAVGRLEGVADVRADHEAGRVVVTAGEEVGRADIEAAIEDAGYEVIPDGPGLLPVTS